MFKAFSCSLLLSFLVSCSGVEVVDVPSTPAGLPTIPSFAPQYSTEEQSIPSEKNPIMISGNAVYESIDINSALGASFSKVTKPIRYAQISIFERVGSQVSIIQTSQTNQNGNFSFFVPQNKNLLLVVYARTQGTHGNLSIEDTCQPFSSVPSALGGVSSICQKGSYEVYPSNVYALQKNINISSANNAAINLVASFPFDLIKTEISNVGRYSGELLGGAFHILDRMIQAVEFLTAEVGNCSIAGCENFVTSLSKLPLLKIYWRPGFSATGSAVSFYNRANAIVLLGGQNKDPLYSDHDHFDASVILHEFAHYLEDHWSNSDSLGGMHSGGIIDPRLAWSEGFADFFQAAVLNRSEYKDYYFSPNSNILRGFGIPLENQSPGAGQVSVDILAANADGEGNFREFSIARLLWDSIDSNQAVEDQGKDIVENNFPVIWASLTHANGFTNNSYFLRSMGLFNKIVHTELNQSWPNLLSLHKNTPSPDFRRRFGAKVEACAVADQFNFTTNITAGGPAAFYSDYLHNYDIFTYTHSGGVLSLDMSYQVVDQAAPDVLQMALVNVGNFLPRWESDQLSIFSNTANSLLGSATVVTGQTQQSLSASKTLASGTYMLYIIGDHTRSSNSLVTYSLSVNTNNLCLGN